MGGIEYDAYNDPVGYWVHQYGPDGLSTREPVFLKADDVIFYFSKRRPSQRREMSDMAPTVTRIRDANEYMVAVSVKQRIEACLAVFIKRAAPAGGFGRPGPGSATARQNYEGKTLSPGMMKELNQGDDIAVVNPQGQSADATEFLKLMAYSPIMQVTKDQTMSLTRVEMKRIITCRPITRCASL